MQKQLFPRDLSFRALLNRQTNAVPTRPAIRSGADARVLSYEQLNQAVLTQEALWRDSGKHCLGVLCNGTPECVLTIFGAVLAGLQVVLFDGNISEAELPELLQKTDVDCLWGAEELEEDMSPWLTGKAENGAGKLLFFTSGTTSFSKAVVLTEASLCASAWNGSALLPLSQEDTLLCVLPLNHVFGFVCGLLWGLACGACVALGRGPRYYAEDLKLFQPTAISVVPLLLGFLLKQNALNEALRLVLIGAGDCPPALPAALQDRGIRVSFGYGLTETSSGVALSLGADPYAMTVCPDDELTLAEDGEILIRCESCRMQGYYKDPDATEAILKDGVLHTGDLGHFDENGLLHVTGRKKEILVFPDGTKLYLPEYEAKLRTVLPDRDFAVIESKGAPALFLRGKESERAAVSAALEPVMRELPLARRLNAIYFDPAPLPRTATGKIQRWMIQKKVGNIT